MFIEVKINRVRVVFLHATHLLDLIYVPTKNIKLSLTVWEFWPAQDFGTRRDKKIMEKVKVLLNTTCLLVLIYASTKYY